VGDAGPDSQDRRTFVEIKKPAASKYPCDYSALTSTEVDRYIEAGLGDDRATALVNRKTGLREKALGRRRLPRGS
jgi:hypothetical protein